MVPLDAELDVDSDHDVPPVVDDEDCSPEVLDPDRCRLLNSRPNVACRLSDVCTPTESLVDELLPRDLTVWMDTAKRQRVEWRRDSVPMEDRKPRLLRALNELYAPERVPWLAGPEDSWL